MEEAKKGPVRVEIFGQEYLIKTDEDEEYVRAVARLVDERMHQLAATTASASSLSVAVLAALNLAGDYLRSKKEVEERSRQLMSLIEESGESSA